MSAHGPQVVRYGTTAIALHWLIALGVIGGFALGVYMHDLVLSPLKLKLYSYHKWIGISVLALMLVRIGWRLSHRPPALDLPVWQRSLANGVHIGLYLLLLVLPLSGWLMSSALGFQVIWFGVLPLPDLLAKDKLLGEALIGVHRNIGWVMLGLVVAHVAAALKHQWIDRDGTLERMLPDFSRKSP